MIILPFSFTAHGELLAITDNAIQGSAPYLTFDEGKTKATDTSGLLGIKLSDETTITKDSDVSTGTDPIALPKDDDTFASVMTLVPLFADNAAYPTIKLTELIKDKKYWGDDNGDENPSVTPAAANLTVAWYSGSTTATNGTDITATVKTTPDRALTHCDAPYRLTITSTAGTLSTEYGDPKSSTFTASNHSYFIKPKPPAAPYVCFALPNLTYNYPGPVTQWNGTKGFKLQDKATPSSNFPTTGANNLFFDLTIENGSSADVGYIKESGGSSEVDIEITQSPLGANMVRVRLIGPTDANKPTEIFSPTTFNLYSDTGKTNLIYSFRINGWFIARPGLAGQYNTSAAPYCNSLGYNYRVPLIVDYTNGSTSSKYKRTINGGFFAEWGNTSQGYYSYNGNNGNWENAQYWTPQACNGYTCSVTPYDGGVGWGYYERRTACIAGSGRNN